jgi:ferric-dicitrate binding protein FerR (iron transport regulator)
MIDGLDRNWQRLAREMATSFKNERVALVKKSVLNQHRAQVKHRRIAVVSLTGLLLLGGLTWTMRDHPSLRAFAPAPSTKSLSPVSSNEKTSLSREELVTRASKESGDSPRAVPLSAGTRFSMEEELSTRTYRIEKGIIRFETKQRETKRLVVHVGILTIEDIGTIFTVETLSDTQARVSVTEGQILVTWPSGRVELEAGKEGIFPLVGDATQAQDATRKPLSSALSGQVEDWRWAARKGQNTRALKLIDEDPARVSDRTDDLLLAADVMRLTGHPRRAVAYLKRVVNRFPHNARSASAAFTLGKVFLDELGRPRQAAGAFAIAARDNSPLAEEASAREVEAWSRAQEPGRAHAAAMRYLRNFPKGARADMVRALADIAP